MERRISNRSNNNQNSSKLASHSPIQSNLSVTYNNNHTENLTSRIKLKTEK